MTVNYAGFWRRFVALVIDILTLTFTDGIFLQIYLLMNGVYADDLNPFRFQLVIVMSLFILGFSYFSISHFQWGCTLGKRLLGVRVVDAKTLGPLGAGQAMGRYLASVLSYLTLLVGFVMAAWDSKKRSLHDRVCSTVCIVR